MGYILSAFPLNSKIRKSLSNSLDYFYKFILEYCIVCMIEGFGVSYDVLQVSLMLLDFLRLGFTQSDT
jgi:hypothetical protein